MKFAWIALGILPAFAPASPSSQQVAHLAWQRLERVGQETARFDARDWGHKLSADDLDLRERAYAGLVDLAVNDDAARAALETWAKDASNPELAWTARLALRELERRPGTHLRALKDFGGGAMDDLRGRFHELERRFGGLDALFGDLQRDFDNAFQGSTPPGASRHSRSESYQMRVTPDGVEIELDEDVDGQRKARKYSGRSMEEILEANPELREKIGNGPHVQSFTFPDPYAPFPPGQNWSPFARGTDAGRGSLSRPAKPLGKPDAVRTDILGVQYTTPTDEMRKKLGLSEGVGIEVERAEPNTIASALGLQAGDVVIALNGRTLKNRDDVVGALRDRKAGEAVRLEVVDPQGKRHTLTWTER